VAHCEGDLALRANALAKTPCGRSSPLWDILTVAVVVVPVLGTFFPLELYLAIGAEEASVASAPASGATTSTYIVAVSLAVLALYFVSGRSFPIMRRFASVLLLTYALIAFSTALWSPDPTFTMKRGARLIPYVGFGLLFSEYFNFEKLIRLLTRSFFIAISCSVVIAVVRPDLGLSNVGGGYENAWRGATVQKNILGQVSSVSMLVCCFSFVYRSNNFLFSFLTLIMSLVTLVLSQSATSAATAGAELVVASCFGAAARSGLKAKIGLFAATAVVATFAIVIAVEPDLVASIADRDATLTGRTYIWAAVTAAIDRSPFWGEYYGFWGIDSTARQVIWRQVGYHVPHAHNSWLDVWLQLGLPGLVVLIFILLIAVRTGARLYCKVSDPLVVFSLALVTALLVRSGSEVEFTDPFPSGLFWLGLASGCLSRANAAIKASSAHPGRAAAAGPFLAAPDPTAENEPGPS